MAFTISSSSSLIQEKDILRQFGPLSSRDNRRFFTKIIQEEIFAAKMMRNLTERFGTRGKSAKSIFLQGFRNEMMGRGKKRFMKILSQKDPDDVKSIRDGQSPGTPSKTSDTSKIIIRPAAMVLYSKFCRRLELLVKNQVFHLGLVPPGIDSTSNWLYDDARQDSFKVNQNETSLDDIPFELANVNDLLDESEEKMVQRLKIYKRAMSCLILHCEALRPILREIKRSYESALKLREHQLLEISWMTQNIGTAEREIQEKTKNIGFEGHNIIKLMDSQCKQLMRHIDQQDSAIRVMTDILNKLENALGEQHELRRDSDDQNKMFVNDINHLRRKLGMPLREEEGLGDYALNLDDPIHEEVRGHIELFHYTTDDPMILRKCLDIARYDLAKANKRLEALEEEHKNEIPRHHFEEMKGNLRELEINHEELKVKTKDTHTQVQSTKEQIEKLLVERDDLKKQAVELRLKITPRPSWEKVGEFVDGGMPRWKGLYEGKSSIEVSNKMIEELNAKKTASAPEYLTAFGLELDIPRCLRHDKRVRDRRLQRRDAEVIIQDIWKSRIKLLETVGKMLETSGPSKAPSVDDFGDPFSGADVPVVTNFPEFVVSYFEEKFPDIQRRMEWTYNLVDACKRLTMNLKLSQFNGILMNRIDEGCYHLLRSELSKLYQLFQSRSSELGHPEGSMSLGDVKQLIEEVYPTKNEDEMRGLVRVISKQSKAHADWTTIKYDQLFVEGDEGYEGEFVEEFSRQLDEDRTKYIHEIIQGLLLDLRLHYDYIEKKEDPAGDTEVHIKQFYKTLVAVDPDMNENIGAALAWVYTRTSALPGLGPRGLGLVNYIKIRLNVPESSEKQLDDLEFEKAMRELRSNFVRGETTEEAVAHKHNQSKVPVSQSKLVKLRVLIRRLREGAFMNHSMKIKTPIKSEKTERYPGEYPGEYDDYEEYKEEGEEEGELSTI